MPFRCSIDLILKQRPAKMATSQRGVAFCRSVSERGIFMAELQVNLSAVLRNYHVYAAGGTVIPVLKDNAYGLGAEVLLRLLQREGVTLFACGTAAEALQLAPCGADLLLLASVQNPKTLYRLLLQRVTLSVESVEQARAIAAFGIPAHVHLAVDTGFGRFGFHSDAIPELKAVFSIPGITVTGIYSHFRGSRSAPRQFVRFQQVLDALSDYPVGLRHIAASNTALHPDYRLDAVRIGSGLTGRLPGLEPAAQLCGEICSLRELDRGSRIGYGDARLRRDSRIAVIDVGTADGAFLHRKCGLRGFLRQRRQQVLVQGIPAAVLGSPGLTHTIIDLRDIPAVPGETVQIEQTPALISPAVFRRYLTD